MVRINALDPGGICSAVTFDSRMHVACDRSRDLARVFQHPLGNMSKEGFSYHVA